MATTYETLIRAVPDYPVPGVLFRDITPLLGNAGALKAAVGDLAEPFRDERIDRVVAIEARGYLFGAPLALELGVGFVPVRKAGKLPLETFRSEYVLEYGKAAIEVHQDGVPDGHRVLLVDDVLATGGTMAAACDLVRQAGAEVAGIAVLIELEALAGRARFGDTKLVSLVRY